MSNDKDKILQSSSPFPLRSISPTCLYMRRSQNCKNSVKLSVYFWAFGICVSKSFAQNVDEIDPSSPLCCDETAFEGAHEGIPANQGYRTQVITHCPQYISRHLREGVRGRGGNFLSPSLFSYFIYFLLFFFLFHFTTFSFSLLLSFYFPCLSFLSHSVSDTLSLPPNHFLSISLS